jgi:hypothetical protein
MTLLFTQEQYSTVLKCIYLPEKQVKVASDRHARLIFARKIAGPTLIKKIIKFSSYKRKILSGAVAKSYSTNGLLIYGKNIAHFLIYVLGSPSSHEEIFFLSL